MPKAPILRNKLDGPNVGRVTPTFGLSNVKKICAKLFSTFIFVSVFLNFLSKKMDRGKLRASVTRNKKLHTTSNTVSQIKSELLRIVKFFS